MIWQRKKIEDCLEKIPRLGSVLSSKTLKEGKYPIIDQGQDFIAGYTNDKSLVFLDCLPVIIFGDHTRALKFIDFPFAVGADGTKVLKPTKDFDPRFFYYMLLSLDLQSRGYARHFKILRESEIPAPSLSEQKKIVKILDAKMEKIKEAKKLREEALADTEKILSQTLHEIFEEGRQEGWKEQELGEVLEKIVGGGTPSKSKPDFWNGDVPWASVKDLKEGQRLIKKTRDFITKKGLENSSSNLIPKGSLIISTRMGLGRVAKNTIDMAINQDLKALFPKKIIDIDFLTYILVNKAEEIILGGKGATVSGIKLDFFRKIKILVPSLSEQQKIVKRLDVLSEKIRQAVELQKSQLEDLKKLEKAYLREAFNGELK